MFQTKVTEKSKHTFHVQYFKKNRAVYEKMWKNITEPDMPQMTIWRMRTACWKTEAKNTQSELLFNGVNCLLGGGSARDRETTRTLKVRPDR
jgi:hypothetical protein